MNFMKEDTEVSILPSHNFTSAWMSQTAQAEWIYVDLGAEAEFDKMKLYWICPPSAGVIETSDDAKTWKRLLTCLLAKMKWQSREKDDMYVFRWMVRLMASI
jgi:hypothetical protein